MEYAVIDTRNTSLNMVKDAARPWAVIRSDITGRFTVHGRYSTKQVAMSISRKRNTIARNAAR
ncbi:hypothetical protein EOA32_01070 [Mesorhizobium sp. M1A.F.Ca.ET.072.01.1.1]|uniref:hypothetical protein n=1 Tax=Mesorhizobium sp. M1A.F.Ca.ET.072.01.1.1 TaxID=2496753 RepID=UPI000FD41692|nr:hypothetical protein [Mesorhizobium sp. M1A.F.Ca.ET.072.01.1.1]RUW55641.1 hypothetical protein EOA32_01070 [Mesorhizobium sp. M1A.F.Ca.ET.072.01.1.1]